MSKMNPQFKFSAVRTGSQFRSHFSSHTYPPLSSPLGRNGSNIKQQPASLSQGRQRLCSLTKATGPCLLWGKGIRRIRNAPKLGQRAAEGQVPPGSVDGWAMQKETSRSCSVFPFPCRKASKILLGNIVSSSWCFCRDQSMMVRSYLSSPGSQLNSEGIHRCLSSIPAQSLGFPKRNPSFEQPECGRYSYPSTGQKVFLRILTFISLSQRPLIY